MAPVRLVAADERMHANTGEPHFNESMDVNFFDERQRLGGFLRIGYRPDEGHPETAFSGPEGVHESLRATLSCVDGSTLEVDGRVLSLIPLRNRRDGKVTQISEGTTEWHCEGRTGFGLSEYLDQIA